MHFFGFLFEQKNREKKGKRERKREVIKLVELKEYQKGVGPIFSQETVC